MNLRMLTMVTLAAIGLMVTACSDDTSGSGGTGGDGTGGTAGMGTGGTAGMGGTGGMGGTAGMGGTGGTGGTMCTNCCGDHASDMTIPICMGAPGEALWDALSKCACDADPMVGKCAMDCAMNVCMGMSPDAACTTCLTTPDTGCAAEFSACSGDVCP